MTHKQEPVRLRSTNRTVQPICFFFFGGSSVKFALRGQMVTYTGSDPPRNPRRCETPQTLLRRCEAPQTPLRRWGVTSRPC